VLAPFFDVTTKDIKARLLASLMPFNQKFYMEYQKKPDLYGPFWIIWTLVVVLTIAGNLSRWMEYEDPDKHFSYEISIVPISISVLFGIVIGVPVGLRFVMKIFGSESS
jgi:protein YIPF1/2